MSGGRLADKVALVTGGGSRTDGVGTGRAAAVLAAREGARVAVVDRDLAAAQHTVDLIEAEGGVAIAIQADATSSDSCRSMVQAVLGEWGRIDLLDNNIGIEGAGTLLQADDALWERVWRLNVETVVKVSREVIPHMAEAGGGAIVNIASISAFRPRGLTPYTTTKGAVISLSQAMAIDHAQARIRVNCIAPGPIYTPMVAGEGMEPGLREKRRLASPLEIEGTAWDVGHAAVYLLSDEARFVTGVVLTVDGGVSVRSPDR